MTYVFPLISGHTYIKCCVWRGKCLPWLVHL